MGYPYLYRQTIYGGIFFGYYYTTVLGAKAVQEKASETLTSFFIKSFFIKMVFYGAYIIILFNFYTFSHVPFILSFSGCFITLHIGEAFFFNSTLL